MIEVVTEPPATKLPLMVKCKHCLAELKVTSLEDINHLKGDQREPEPSLWINCPRCQNKVILAVKEFTQYDLIRIQKKGSQMYLDNLR